MLVDLGKGPKPLSKKEEDLNADPEALRAAIQVVEGSKVEKLSSRKLVGRCDTALCNFLCRVGGVYSCCMRVYVVSLTLSFFQSLSLFLFLFLSLSMIRMLMMVMMKIMMYCTVQYRQ